MWGFFHIGQLSTALPRVVSQIASNYLINCQLHDIVEINDIIFYENCPLLIHKSGYYLTVFEVGDQNAKIKDTDGGRQVAALNMAYAENMLTYRKLKEIL